MMFTVLMLAALQVMPASTEVNQPPILRNPQAIVTPQDYPTSSLRKNEFGIVSLLLQVSIDGKVSSCDVTESTGFEMLDTETCSLFKHRARFNPGRDMNGSVIPMEYRIAIVWGMEGHWPRADANVSLKVSRIPSDYRNAVKARILFGATGRVTACDVTDTSGSEAADKAVSAYITEQLAIAAPKSVSSQVPATAVRYLTASLSADASEGPENK